MNYLQRCLVFPVLLVSVVLFQSLPAQAQDAAPNVVVIFIDDLGYADIGPFGAKAYKTPHLDEMAKQGRRFTDFVTSTAVCSASRAALMTGCYHRRVGISGALGPKANIGINSDEMTLAEVCKQKIMQRRVLENGISACKRNSFPCNTGSTITTDCLIRTTCGLFIRISLISQPIRPNENETTLPCHFLMATKSWTRM